MMFIDRDFFQGLGRYLLIGLGLIVLLLAIAPFVHADYIQENGFTYTFTQSNTAPTGDWFTVNVAGLNTSAVNKTPSDTSSHCAIYAHATSYAAPIATGTFIGNKCLINVALVNGNSYNVVGYGATLTGTYTEAYQTGVTFPVSDSKITWEGGGITDGALTMWNYFNTITFTIESITLIDSAPPPPPATILSFTASDITNESVLLAWLFNNTISNLSLTRDNSVIYTTNDTSITNITNVGLTPITHYNYTLFISSSGGFSDFASLNITTLNNTIVPPQNSTTDKLLQQLLGVTNAINEAIGMLWIIALMAVFLALTLILREPIFLALEAIPFMLMTFNQVQLVSAGNNPGNINFYLGIMYLILGVVFCVIGAGLQLLKSIKNAQANKKKRTPGSSLYENFYGEDE